MANEEHLNILKQGVKKWNKWRSQNLPTKIDPRELDVSKADLSGADLSGASLRKADLSEVDLSGANLSRADLSEANLFSAKLRSTNLCEAHLDYANLTLVDLRQANMSQANLWGADLCGTNLSGANLHEAYFYEAKLRKANLFEASLISTNLHRADLRLANLHQADLRRADLRQADLRQADLHQADLRSTLLIGADFTRANLSGCRVFGISAWRLKLDSAFQSDLIITDDGEPEITVDNLEVAQFIYLLLNNQNIRAAIDTLTTKAVLILGRFSPERKVVLDTLRDELRRRNYLPILFDFEKPANRDLTETVMTLASMARFVIADLSDPHSIPHELMTFGDKLLSVPIQAIFCPVPEHKWEYPMFEHLARFPHVLPIYRYDDQQQLLDNLSEKVIDPAEAKVLEMKPKSL